MRQQVAAANWKMNLTFQQAEELINGIINTPFTLSASQRAVFAVPFPYLSMVVAKLKGHLNTGVAAQNCYTKTSGAYTGETSVEMLKSINVGYVVLGHSERREYFNESNEMLAEKVNTVLAAGLTPIFCCGEALAIREAGTQNEYVANQLKESLYHLSADELKKVIIAYEPIWAIGTGKTATSEQAQEMHAHLRGALASKYGTDVANEISILYGGSVKGSNAKEIFGQPDVDGGLVGGASLKADEFVQIIQSLK
ncbi:MAG: triose-phosphate isomerase [Chitinophagaceae bacterium]|nr:triose-phosphate isomerase [Chitinophagaceae bacterium]